MMQFVKDARRTSYTPHPRSAGIGGLEEPEQQFNKAQQQLSLVEPYWGAAPVWALVKTCHQARLCWDSLSVIWQEMQDAINVIRYTPEDWRWSDQRHRVARFRNQRAYQDLTSPDDGGATFTMCYCPGGYVKLYTKYRAAPIRYKVKVTLPALGADFNQAIWIAKIRPRPQPPTWSIIHENVWYFILAQHCNKSRLCLVGIPKLCLRELRKVHYNIPSRITLNLDPNSLS